MKSFSEIVEPPFTAFSLCLRVRAHVWGGGQFLANLKPMHIIIHFVNMNFEYNIVTFNCNLLRNLL